jgi:hypothetical protein
MRPNLFADLIGAIPPAQPARDPATVLAVDACPHCMKRLVVVHAFDCDGVTLQFYRCSDHGTVDVPRRVAAVMAGPAESDPNHNLAPRAKWSVPC